MTTQPTKGKAFGKLAVGYHIGISTIKHSQSQKLPQNKPSQLFVLTSIRLLMVHLEGEGISKKFYSRIFATFSDGTYRKQK